MNTKNEVTNWFNNDFHFIGATDKKLSFGECTNDFEFTISFMVDNYFKCSINYVSGRNNFLLDVIDTGYNETLLHFMVRFNDCKTFNESLSRCLIMIAQLIENSDY